MVVKVIVLLLVLLQLAGRNVMLVGHCALATDGRHRVQIRVHSSNKQTRVVGPAADDILRPVVPGNPCLETTPLAARTELHDPADVVWLAEVLGSEINVVF